MRKNTSALKLAVPLIAMVSFPLWSAPIPTNTASIAGIVRNENGAPVRASLTAISGTFIQRTLSAPNGAFQLQQLRAGAYAPVQAYAYGENASGLSGPWAQVGSWTQGAQVPPPPACHQPVVLGSSQISDVVGQIINIDVDGVQHENYVAFTSWSAAGGGSDVRTMIGSRILNSTSPPLYDLWGAGIAVDPWPPGAMITEVTAVGASGSTTCGRINWTLLPYNPAGGIVGVGPGTSPDEGGLSDDYTDPNDPPLPPDDGQPPDTILSSGGTGVLKLTSGRTVRIIRAIHVSPQISSNVEASSGTMIYHYSLRHEIVDATQSGIRTFDVAGAEFRNAKTPDGWFGLSSGPGVTPSRFGWIVLGDEGMKPGEKAGPFSVESALLPGLVKAYVQSIQAERPGNVIVDKSASDLQRRNPVETLSETDEWQVANALSIENNSVQTFVVGPKLIKGPDLLRQIVDELRYAGTIPELMALAKDFNSASTQLEEGHTDWTRAQLMAVEAHNGLQKAFLEAILVDLNCVLGIK